MAMNQKDVLKKYKNIYLEAINIPFVSKGWVQPKIPTQLIVQYIQQDINRNKNQIVLRSFNEGNSFSFEPFPFAMQFLNVLMIEPSPSWNYLAVIRSIAEKDDTGEKYLIEIWDSSSVALTISTEGKHSHVYADEVFGSFVWSKDEKYLAYIAERNSVPGESFFNNKPSNNSNEKIVGGKYLYKENWGENYKGANPTIFITDLENEDIIEVSGIPEDMAVGQVQFSPKSDHLIFTGWETEPYRLGIQYCYNRPSAIYALPIDFKNLSTEKEKKGESEVKTLLTLSKEKELKKRKIQDKGNDSNSNIDNNNNNINNNNNNDTSTSNIESKVIRLTFNNPISTSPRISPDGKILVFLASDDTICHDSNSKLMKMEWFGEKDKLVGEEVVVIGNEDELNMEINDFPGLFISKLPQRPFIEHRKVVFSVIWRSTIVPILVDLESGSLRKLELPGCETTNISVRDVQVGICALFDGSEINRPPFIFVGRWDSGNSNFKNWKVTPHASSRVEFALKLREKFEWQTCRTKKVPGSDFDYVEYIFACSRLSQKNHKQPLILLIHGGPHSISLPLYSSFIIFFLKSGFAVIMPNYRGSTGFGRKYLHSLLGHVGEYDVEDCLAVLDDALENFSDRLDRNKLFVSGGSHGGFITCHLLARKDRSWRAGSVRNAVTNVASLVGTSDIPDWSFAETGTDPRNLEGSYSQMYRKSPLAVAENITAPTLIGVGSCDKRVHPTQSIEFYRKLKTLGVKTEMILYPNAGHAISEPEYNADFMINTVLWFKDNL